MTTTNFTYLRALEMEGRHPKDAGAWQATIKRLEFGEGVPPAGNGQAVVSLPPNGVLPPAPSISPSVLRPGRSGYYRRLRTTGECERFFLNGSGVEIGLSLYLFPGWEAPPEGNIPMPAVGERPLPMTHFVVATGVSPEHRKFQFLNWWGEGWGAGGAGSLPYDYFDAHVFESYGSYFAPRLLLSKEVPADDHLEVRWVAEDESVERVYGFEVKDLRGEDRRGWAFVVAREGALEVEELYVRREYRGCGYGRRLVNKVLVLAQARQMPLRLWVSFADAQQESPQTYPAMLALARRMGVLFQRCPVRWAAYFATNESGGGSPVPPEADVPPRPRSALKAVLAAVQATALAAHAPAVPARAEGPPPPLPNQAGLDAAQHPQIGTVAWGEMNKRRAALIRKEIQGDLSEEERSELERLQRLSLAALEEAYPRNGTLELAEEGRPQ